MRPIHEVAADLHFTTAEIQPWGPGVAKISPEAAFHPDSLKGKLVLVSAISPTPAGEGQDDLHHRYYPGGATVGRRRGLRAS